MKELICFCINFSKAFEGTGRTLTGLESSLAWGSFFLKIGVMSANLRLGGNFLELVKDLFISDVKVSAEYSDEIFKIFDGIVLKRLVFYC